MRKILLLLFIPFALASCGSYTPVTMEPISHTFTVDKEKDDLYVSANNWMVENFNDAKSVVQFRDKEAGVVTGKYLLKDGLAGPDDDIFAVIKLQMKEGASKITIIADDFQSITGSAMNEKVTYDKEAATAQVNEMIQSYEQYIKNDRSHEW